MSRGRPITVAVFGALAVAALAFSLGRNIASPSQRAADAAPPKPSLLTALVEQRVVGETLSVKGEVAAAGTVAVNPSAPEGESAVVTAAPLLRGDAVSEGDVLVVVADRPAIALAGAVPAFRDLRPGVSGTDIEQLQASLERLGYLVSDRVGLFGQGTQAAVRRLYEDRGFSAPLTSVDAMDQLADAAAAAATARQRAIEPADDPTAEQLSLDAFREAEKIAQTLVATTGVMVPQREISFVGALPAIVIDTRAVVGATSAGATGQGSGMANTAPLLTLGTGTTRVLADLQAIDIANVKVGQAAEVALWDGSVVSATVESVSDRPETNADGKASYRAIIAGQLPADSVGRAVRVDITITTSEVPVMAVPSAAISADAGGTRGVTRVVDGALVHVPVRVGASAGGWVQVTTIEAGLGLAPGDEVVIADRVHP